MLPTYTLLVWVQLLQDEASSWVQALHGSAGEDQDRRQRKETKSLQADSIPGITFLSMLGRATHWKTKGQDQFWCLL